MCSMTCQLFASGLILRTGIGENNPKEVDVGVSFRKEREYSLSKIQRYFWLIEESSSEECLLKC